MDDLEGLPFSELLRRFRERKQPKLTQLKLADALGVNRQTVVAWERGDYPPKDRTRVVELAQTLQLSDQETATFLQAALFEPLTVWHVPHHRDPLFTGRKDVLQELFLLLKPGSTVALTQPQAINGLGGIGKTATAVEYVYSTRQEYHSIFWLQADSREILFSECVKLAHLLQLQEHLEQDQKLIIDAVRRWLRGHQRWLLILDNVEDFQMIQEFLPPGHRGNVLITTRAQDTGSLVQSHELKSMTQQEGMLFLSRRTKLLTQEDTPLDSIPAEQLAALQHIWQEMEGLPLALDQAGAYMVETASTPVEYLKIYQQRRNDLLAERGQWFIGHPASVVTTFFLCFEKIEQMNALATDILRMCAFLYAEAIPEELFLNGAHRLGTSLSSSITDPIDWNRAIATLRSYSLIHREGEPQKTLTVHRLVQAVLKDAMEKPTFRHWVRQAVLAVNSSFPSVNFQSWSQCERYISHTQVCAEYVLAENMQFVEAATLLNQGGYYLSERGRYREAEPLLRRAVSMYERLVGFHHPATARSMNNLAMLYEDMGRYEKAGPLYTQILALRRRLLGEEHSETSQSLNNLATFYMKQQRFAEAEPLLQAVVVSRSRIFGRSHASTLLGVNNLAACYAEQGKYEKAEPLYLEAVTFLEQKNGTDHPHTVTCVNNLGMLYAEQGKYAKAEPLLQRVLVFREQTAGPADSHTAMSLNNLGMLYAKQGKYAEAELLLERALAIYEQGVGIDHPDVLHVIENLVEAYKAVGKYEKIKITLQQLLAFYEKSFGKEHPYTKAIQSHYKALLQKLQHEKKTE